jgi:hypothetical protein
MTRVLLDAPPGGAERYFVDFGDDASDGRALLIWEDRTPGDPGRVNLALPARAAETLARVLVARIPQDERLRDDLTNALSELAWQYEQAMARAHAAHSMNIAVYPPKVLSTTTDVLQLADTPKSISLPIRLAVNLLAALWIAVASWRMGGATRVIGLIVAIDTALYSAVALLTPFAFVVTLPALVLLPLWFWLVGRQLAQTAPALRVRQ